MIDLKKIGFLLGLVFFFKACQPHYAPKKPECLLSIDSLSQSISDFYILKAGKKLDRKTYQQLGLPLRDYLFLMYGIDEQSLEDNINYYCYLPKGREALFKAVEIRLQSKIEVLNENIEKYQIQKEVDSLNENLNTTN